MSDMPVLPEYASNPFIAQLPAVHSQRELMARLQRLPHFDEKERHYSASLRKHCVLRLGRFFAPMARQIKLAENIGMLLRQGYVGRNPLTCDYVRHLHNGAERIEAGSLHATVSEPVENTASSFALVGCSGVGKSVAINRVLHSYPQVIRHVEPFSIVQIVWLKLECPIQGSPRQLCINFFQAVDELIGTTYRRKYGAKSVGADEMLTYMTQVAQLHALGVLVIDELQNLKEAKIGSKVLLNFLVALVNTIGVPVILIGTLGATSILQGNFRDARRGTGIGSAIWDRLPRGAEWNHFVERLWSYQWTCESTPLSDQLKEVLYEETQGIVDILVKLYMLVQMRLISIAEVRKKATEAITPQLIQRVAREDLQLVQPMLQALRDNDKVALKKYDDLAPLQKYVEAVLNTALQGGGAPAAATDANPGNDPGPNDGSVDMHAMLLRSLAAIGVQGDVAEVLVAQLVAANPSGDPLLLLQRAVEQLKAKPVRTGVPKAEIPREPELPPMDLRRLVAEGSASNLSAYDALVAAGVVRSPLGELAA